MRSVVNERRPAGRPTAWHGDYLWFDVEVDGAEGPEFALLGHGLMSAMPKVGTMQISPGRLADGLWTYGVTWHHTGTGTSRIAADLGREPAVTAVSSLGAAEAAYGLVHRMLMTEAHTRGYTRLHAAMVDIGDRRVVLAGSSGSGKTTLAMKLVAAGAVLQSDEGVLLRDGCGVGLPRRLHVKSTGIGLLSAVVARGAARLGYRPPVYAVDPAAIHPAGADLRSTERRVDQVILLGSRTDSLSLAPLSSAEALAELLPEAAGYASAAESLTQSQSRLVQGLAGLLSAAPVFRLTGHQGAAGAKAVLGLA